MTHVLVIVFNDLARDPRVHRQLQSLTQEHEVTAAGFGKPRVHTLKTVDLQPPPSQLGSIASKARGLARIAARRFDAAYWHNRQVRIALERLENIQADVVLCNDIDTLPLALRVARGAPVVFDAHEYYPEQFAHVRWWRLLLAPHIRHLCRTYIPQTARMTTAWPGSAARYEEECGVRPQVVLNAPPYAVLEPTSVTYPIRLVHHGVADRRRKLHLMIETMRHLDDRFTLDMILVDRDPRELSRLKQLAKNDPRISFRTPVPMPDIPRYTNDYDVGIYLLEPRNFNQLYWLPNKLFEFIQARLCIATGPFPGIASMVREHDLGVVSEDFSVESFADMIASLTPDIIVRHKRRAHSMAPVFCAHSEQERLMTIIGELAAATEPAT